MKKLSSVHYDEFILIWPNSVVDTDKMIGNLWVLMPMQILCFVQF